MFEQALYNYIEQNFDTSINRVELYFGFGEVDKSASNPYIAQYSLNRSGDRQFLCNENDFTDGTAFIQWNIYCDSPKLAFKLKNELMVFIGQIKKITLNGQTYLIKLNQAESSPSGQSLNNGLFSELVVRSFNYNMI
jgi:hypothetical protein